jgi:hypothetical protein
MHSSVEVLRVLSLGGIAPVGRGGETRQQAVGWSSRKQINTELRSQRKRFPEAR